ncbi:MAG: leucyl/phenylalanyl-tRNA--protein transferase [Gammaproteobacteria bacterium]|nr:leucyl/phenylalanyl-tRNA--protein transferase [Gammaproteobacteria bacterium]
MLQIPSEFWLDQSSTPFPNVDLALKEPNGLIAIGGELSTERLLSAYSQGIFPWYANGEPILWYSPDPRMVIKPECFHLSKNLFKVIRSARFEVRENTNFEKVINLCRHVPRIGQDDTWIDNDMVAAYCKLHREGYAHSYEVYEKDSLVGGLYGVALGEVFFGESMFSLVSNTSKVAFASLLQSDAYKLVDCQVENEHLKSLGATNISRDLFIQQLKAFV